ncbi:hypothetical protein, partial [Aliarcobacter butzleri]|uniref:hypothetical protein n=1 Tax=Aliarcobacter butzleri TaxID=28197 RepID=UPI003AF91300
SFGYTRKSLLSQIEKIADTVGQAATAKKMMTGSLFGDSEALTKIDIELEHFPEGDPKELLGVEKATLGFYVPGHPL